jgi:ribonuclease P protein component
MVFGREWPRRAVGGCWRPGVPRAGSACLPERPARLVRPLGRVATPRVPDPADDGLAMATGLVRLKTRADFLRVAAGRRRAVRPGLLLQAAAQPPESVDAAVVRVGFTASRRVGNAVTRNRAKRRLRAAAAQVLKRDGRPGTDYVLIARGGTGERPYAELVGDLEAALRQVERGGGHRPSRRGEED